MTDDPFLPGPMPAPTPVEDAAPSAAPAAAGSRRRLVVLGAAAGALALLGGGYVLLGGGSDASPAPVAVPRHHLVHRVPASRPLHAAPAKAAPAKAAPAHAAPAKGQPQALGAVPATFTGTHVRDPFRPLISPPPPPPQPKPTTAAAASSPTGTGGATSAGGAAAPAGTGSAAAKPATTHRVTLDAASGSSLTATVDGKQYRAVVGQVFAQFFKVVSVQGGCATLQYGDSAFDLCRGHTVTLQ